MPDRGQSSRTALHGDPHRPVRGGCGWAPTMYDRIRHQIEVSGHGRRNWLEDAIGARELLLRKVWYCSISDPIVALNRGHLTMGVDYLHADSTWPGCQDAMDEMIGHLPADVIADIIHRNAAALFRRFLPAETLP